MGNYSLVWILVSLSAVIAVLMVAIRFGIQRDDGRERRSVLDLGRLRSSFRTAVGAIEANIAGRDKRYDVPWVVLLHDGDAATRPPIEACGISSALAGAQPAWSSDGPRWHLFDRGVVVELESDQLDAPVGRDDLEKRWEEFLSLCGRYRPQRPLDSVIVSVPAALLADRTPEGRERLRHRAAATSRRIWIAQNRYAMRFAVYVVISGAEQLPGFAPFAEALPAGMRDSMLGWASPFQPATLYRRDWTDTAFNQIEQDVADLGAELFASNAQLPAPTDLFLLPSRIAALRAGAADYLDELMRPNAYHEPFFLRGLWLAGGAELPVFLRGVVEQKVFAEFGLSRAAHSQKLARPMLTRVMRWFMIGVPVVYALGILVTGIQLQRVLPTLAEGLEGLKRDTEYRAQATGMGEKLDFEWYRKTALQLMMGLSELESRRVGGGGAVIYDPNLINPFMPGSWPMFDNVRARAIARIHESFADLAVRTLQQAVYRRTAELTNAPLSPSTGLLTNGSEDCDPPRPRTLALQTGVKSSLAPEDLPEFAALAAYSGDLTRLQASVNAMRRLATLNQDNPKQLRLLVLDMLGADLPGDLQGSANLFAVAASKQGALIDRQPVSLAARCGFVKGMLALNQRLFAENALVRSEEQVQASRNALLNLFSSSEAPDSADVIAAFRNLQEALASQKMLLAHGRGAWLAREEMRLGNSYDKLLKEFADNALVGPEVTEQALRRAREDFARTRQRYLSMFSDDSAGLVAGKDGALELSKERLGLLAAIEQLMTQPLMQPAAGNSLQPTGRGTRVQWDIDQLAKAVKLADGRRKYLTEDLPRFPSELQQAVQDAIDYQYALRVVDLVGHAYTQLGPDTGDATPVNAASYEIASGHLKRLVALLQELDQDDEARTLQGIVATDASARLRQLSSDLQDARLYAPGDDDDMRADGRATLSLFANSGGDVADYLAQQLARVQALSAQAQLLRGALAGEPRSSELSRWIGIARELELNAAKDPKGSVARLERFLLELGRELDATACLAALRANEPPRQPSNYFAERHAELHRMVTRRCTALDRRSFVDQWSAFAQDFNRMLKGRRPFAGNRSGQRAADYLALPPADLSEVGSLLARLPAVSPEIFARNNVPEGSAVPIRDFALQLAQARQLLAPLFPADASQPAAVDVTVRFRANANAEIDGNKIIDWALTIGDQTLKLRDAPRALRWRPGEPVRLTLRFANDAPLSPRSSTASPYLSASRKTAVFSFDGPWALLDMVQLLRDPMLVEGRAATLKLDIPVQTDKDGALRALPVRAFVAVTLSEPGKTAPLPWPGLFPERAPVVER